MIEIDPEKVRAARLRAGFRWIVHAADATGLDYKTIEAYEGHKDAQPPKNPALATLRKIAATYQCAVRDLVKDATAFDRLIADLGGDTPPVLDAIEPASSTGAIQPGTTP